MSGPLFWKDYVFDISFVLFCQNLDMLKCLEFEVTDVEKRLQRSQTFLLWNSDHPSSKACELLNVQRHSKFKAFILESLGVHPRQKCSCNLCTLQHPVDFQATGCPLRHHLPSTYLFPFVLKVLLLHLNKHAQNIEIRLGIFVLIKRKTKLFSHCLKKIVTHILFHIDICFLLELTNKSENQMLHISFNAVS